MLFSDLTKLYINLSSGKRITKIEILFTIGTNGQRFQAYLHRTQHCMLYSQTERMHNPHLAMVNKHTICTKGQYSFAINKLSHQWYELTSEFINVKT